MNKRIYVEKKEGFQHEVMGLRQQFSQYFNQSFTYLRSYVIYDVFKIDEQTFEKAKQTVFSEQLIEIITDNVELEGKSYIAYEPLDGQFDQRADSAMQCIRLIDPYSEVIVKSGRLIVFDEIEAEVLDKLTTYLVNPVESQLKSLDVLSLNESIEVMAMETYDGFMSWNQTELEHFYLEHGFAMTFDDLVFIQNYFKEVGRQPSETELKVLDTYWSDHCRHTTFMTELQEVTFADTLAIQRIEGVFKQYLEDRQLVGRQAKAMTLMDLATINAKLERTFKNDSPIEVSEEVNACSVVIDVDHEGQIEKWLMMFKNETHNHPTEIEPFGGASTCIGGAIRDPLSGRAYVYQAMRISGSANVLAPLVETMEHKLPQSLLAKKATQGNASYGNQIGLPTTYVHEIYHPSYVAKHLECGAVVGAVKQSDVQRGTPLPGDKIILLGGRTGRDGIGGATGSSVQHKESSLKQSAAQVQKGNAPEEHKIQRLFRKPEVTKIIKRCNDFGAGGVCVAIGELADGLDIQLDQVRLKYKGLNPTEIAISESQERMAVVVDAKDVDTFIEAAMNENCEAYVVAEVTDTHRLRMTYHQTLVVDLDRDFLNSAGVKQKTKVKVEPRQTTYQPEQMELNETALLDLVKDLRFASQKGLSERFDHTIGASTIQGGYVGRTQRTPATASVQLLPVQDGKTSTTSILTYGMIPEMFEQSPFLGGMNSVVESVSKTIAVGGNLSSIYLSLQEYFGRLTTPEKWGNVLQSLLGAYHAMKALDLAAIGGKDSMSGTFEQIDVIDTLISFACSSQHVQKIISPELKQGGNSLYVLQVKRDEQGWIDFNDLKEKYQLFDRYRREIVSASTTDRGNVLLTLFKMALGNDLGFDVQGSSTCLGEFGPGSIVLEVSTPIEEEGLCYLGKVTSKIMRINQEDYPRHALIHAHHQTLEPIYPLQCEAKEQCPEIPITNQNVLRTSPEVVDQVRVLIPVFPGTNCEYDSARVFENLGAEVEFVVFSNLTPAQTQTSVEKLVTAIKRAHIIFFAGGFSSGDEPDGSAKYIVNVLKQTDIKQTIHEHLKQERLILGICNGFQALIKSGLIPYGEIRDGIDDGVTLFHNAIGQHVSTWVDTRCVTNDSPWLSSMKPGTVYRVPVSHGEGRIVGNLKQIDPKQIAFQYVDAHRQPTMNYPENPNGSLAAIEALSACDGLILGKMAHSERVIEGQYERQSLFENGVAYFRKREQHGA